MQLWKNSCPFVPDKVAAFWPLAGSSPPRPARADGGGGSGGSGGSGSSSPSAAEAAGVAHDGEPWRVDKRERCAGD